MDWLQVPPKETFCMKNNSNFWNRFDCGQSLIKGTTTYATFFIKTVNLDSHNQYIQCKFEN